jgi:succinylarginine dihydrolase
VARLHGLDPHRTVFIQQSPAAIDAGVFHNDVIAVGHENLLLYHRDAFVDTPGAVDRIRRVYGSRRGEEPHCLEVTGDEFSLADAVATYLFNSQLVTLPDSTVAMICPMECREHDGARRVLNRLLQGDHPIKDVRFVELRQSMHNGGGPACLRLRVILTEGQLARVHRGVLFTDFLHATLTQWVHKYYRDRLAPDDLTDPKLIDESRAALEELTAVLGLGPFYAFQI